MHTVGHVTPHLHCLRCYARTLPPTPDLCHLSFEKVCAKFPTAKKSTEQILFTSKNILCCNTLCLYNTAIHVNEHLLGKVFTSNTNWSKMHVFLSYHILHRCTLMINEKCAWKLNIVNVSLLLLKAVILLFALLYFPCTQMYRNHTFVTYIYYHCHHKRYWVFI